ncbi:MAG TPA: reverse transcriptase family protein [Anaeromyxobacteraceae bacterium]|nr:reverse transcriptase family protein [Anaeromyxobacteraceae bacterium]
MPKGCLTLLAAAALGIAAGVLAGREGWPALGVPVAAATFAAAAYGGFWLPHRLGQRPARRILAWLGFGLGVAELARRLEVSPAELRCFQCSYREVFIPKRRGGTRRLLVPDDGTKALQRRILRRLLGRLRAHPAAHAYERGRSTATNAAPHAGQAVLVKLDLVDFFPSTGSARIERYFRQVGWSRAAAALLTRLTTHDGGLPQGAPTSPRLSNLVNGQLDRLVERFVRRRRGTYTRYADDLSISFPEDWPRQVRGTIRKVREIAWTQGYRVHGKPKLGTYRRHQRQLVTGLVVNVRPDLPRKVRRRLRAIEHRLRTTGRATLTPEQLQGWKAYRAMSRKARPSE